MIDNYFKNNPIRTTVNYQLSTVNFISLLHKTSRESSF